MKEILLFFVALLLFLLLVPIAFLFALFAKSDSKWQRNKKYLMQIAITIDQSANVICAPLFNTVLLKVNTYSFGDEDETISSCLGRNKVVGNLSILGRILDFILCMIDENHSVKSIEY